MFVPPLPAPIVRFFAWVGTIIGAVLAIYYRGRRAGVKSHQDKLKKATDKLQGEHDAIDRRVDTLDDALSRLQARARDRD